MPAGTFTARRYNIHPARPDLPPLELWVHGDENVMVRLDWALLRASYVLQELRQG